jgi:hypothetical protein
MIYSEVVFQLMVNGFLTPKKNAKNLGNVYQWPRKSVLDKTYVQLMAMPHERVDMNILTKSAIKRIIAVLTLKVIVWIVVIDIVVIDHHVPHIPVLGVTRDA